MEWYSIDMPHASLTDGAYHRLCRAFQRAFIGAGAPAEFALFARREAASGRRLYLSPVSATYVPDLIHHYEAQTCDVPDPSSVTLVYGVPGAQALLHESIKSGPSRHVMSPPRRRSETAIYPLVNTRSAASAG